MSDDDHLEWCAASPLSRGLRRLRSRFGLTHRQAAGGGGAEEELHIRTLLPDSFSCVMPACCYRPSASLMSALPVGRTAARQGRTQVNSLLLQREQQARARFICQSSPNVFPAAAGEGSLCLARRYVLLRLFYSSTALPPSPAAPLTPLTLCPHCPH